MIGRAYMEEVLIYKFCWVMSEFFDKQEKEKNFSGSRKLSQAH